MISQARSNGGVAASVSAVPLLVSGPDGTHRAWQIVDIATAPAVRGRGYFRRNLEAIRSELPPSEILVCFPNAKSSPELRRQGFIPVAELKTYARLVFPEVFLWRSARTQGDAARPLVFDRDVSICTPSLWHVARTAEYLNWRYRRHPVHNYAMLVDGPSLDPSGLAIVRRFDAFGIRIAVFMELHARTADVVKRLVNRANDWARHRHLAMMMAIGSSRPTIGFLPVPRPLEPKRHICVAGYSGSTPEADRRIPGPWSVQIGDWDGL